MQEREQHKQAGAGCLESDEAQAGTSQQPIELDNSPQKDRLYTPAPGFSAASPSDTSTPLPGGGIIVLASTKGDSLVQDAMLITRAAQADPAGLTSA